jgi:hypothetical protein
VNVSMSPSVDSYIDMALVLQGVSDDGAVTAFVFCSSILIPVVVSWLGYVALYYYIIPIIIIWCIIFIMTTPCDAPLCHRDNVKFIAGVLSKKADSLLYFYDAMNLRCNKIVPDTCKDIATQALNDMSLYEIRSMLVPCRMKTLRCMFESWELTYTNDVDLFTQTNRHLALVWVVAARECYPPSAQLFMLRRWRWRVTAPLRDVFRKGHYVGLPVDWMSFLWVPSLAGCFLPLPCVSVDI